LGKLIYRQYYFRKERGGKPRGNLADQLAVVAWEKLRKDKYTWAMMMSKDYPTPCIILGDREMVVTIRYQCTTSALHPSVLAFDCTYHLSSCYVTITVYKNKNLYNRGMYSLMAKTFLKVTSNIFLQEHRIIP
jgi:hypothetical protein